MWKKTAENNDSVSEPVSNPSPIHRQPVSEQAVIGSSLVLKGDLHGEEDLVIQGQVEGKVILKNNSITVGKNGQVKADLHGKVIVIEGNVQGNLFGEDKIVVKKSGNVKGNLLAPRINLEEGARFKGSIDMEGAGPVDKQRALPGTPSSPSVAKSDSDKASPRESKTSPTSK
jgi:cytoskeletal protein CcmA (bactofilin family)